MSDTKQSSDWWQASDGKWYPPETGRNFHSPVTEQSILDAWERLHGTNPLVSELVVGTKNLPADDWRRFEPCRGHGSRDKPGEGMFCLGSRWIIAIEANAETQDLVLGELAHIRDVEADDDVVAITSNHGDVFRLVFDDATTAASLDDEISSSLEYFDVGEPVETDRYEHLTVVAVLRPTGGFRPQADTNVNAAGFVTQSWAGLEWFVAVPGHIQESMETFMNRAGAAGWELVAAVPAGYQEAKTIGEALLGDWAIRDQRISTLRAQHLHFKRRREYT